MNPDEMDTQVLLDEDGAGPDSASSCTWGDPGDPPGCFASVVQELQQNPDKWVLDYRQQYRKQFQARLRGLCGESWSKACACFVGELLADGRAY